MRETKTLLLLIALMGTSSLAFAQTKMIAHKSHSGKVGTFSIRGEGNFGLGPMKIAEKVEKLSDTTLVEIGRWNEVGYNGEGTYRDTMKIEDYEYFRMDRNYDLEARKIRYEHIEFVGFTEEELRLKAPSQE